MKWISIFLLGIMLVACGNTRTQQEEVPVLEGDFRIVQVGDLQIDDPEMRMSFKLEDARMNGHAGCNGFSAGYLQNDSSLSFSRPISTKMYCEGKMEVEDRLFELLDAVSAVRSSNGRIELHSTDNKTLITLRKL